MSLNYQKATVKNNRNRVFPVFLAAQRDGHGLHMATARTPAAQGFIIGANQCRLLRLVGWVGLVLGGMLGGRPIRTPSTVVLIGFTCPAITVVTVTSLKFVFFCIGVFLHRSEVKK